LLKAYSNTVHKKKYLKFTYCELILVSLRLICIKIINHEIITYSEEEDQPNENWRDFTTPVENQLVKFHHVTRDYSGYPGELGYGRVDGCTFKSSTLTNAEGEYTVPLSKLEYATVTADIDPLNISYSTHGDCKRSSQNYEIIVTHLKVLQLEITKLEGEIHNNLVSINLAHNISDSFIEPQRTAIPLGAIRGRYIVPNINYTLTYTHDNVTDSLSFYSGDIEEEILKIDIEI